MANALETIKASFPWLENLGLTGWLRQEIADGTDSNTIMPRVRQTPEYQAAFAGIRRDDGTMRMNEAQFLSTQDDYRSVLRQYGIPEEKMNSAQDLAGFMESDLAPTELGERLQMYDTLKRDNGGIRDAFYLYAGIDMSEDDIYNYVVNPDARNTFDSQYNENIATTPLDYGTWLDRAVQLGLNKVADALGELENAGVVTGDAIRRIQSTDPAFATEMMDLLYNGGSPEAAFLNTNELMLAFESAVIGGTATEQGLQTPDRDRVEQFRQNGVDRAAAQKAYSTFSSQRNLIDSTLNRAGISGFTQSDYEDAVFLQKSDPANALRKAQAQEEALGAQSGSVAIGRQGDRLVQGGFKA